MITMTATMIVSFLSFFTLFCRPGLFQLFEVLALRIF